MKVEGDAHLLRVYVGESDRWGGRPLYEAIVRAAREQGLAGATALRGIEGFGASSRIHTVKVLRLSEDLPIVIEILDRPERVAAFLPVLDEMVSEGMVTVEKVHTYIYRHDSVPAQPADDNLELEPTDYHLVADEAPPPPKFTDRASQLIESARKSASQSKRPFVDSVDVLLAMLCEAKGIAGLALAELGVECGLVERSLREAVNRDEPNVSFLDFLTTKSQAEAKWSGHEEIGTEHLLLALCQIRPSGATDILTRLGAQPRDICKEVLAVLGQSSDWQRWLADHPDM